MGSRVLVGGGQKFWCGSGAVVSYLELSCCCSSPSFGLVG